MDIHILLAITFVYGVLRFVSFTKLFDVRLSGLIDALYPKKLPVFWATLDAAFLYFSLCFQAWYWLFSK